MKVSEIAGFSDFYRYRGFRGRPRDLGPFALDQHYRRSETLGFGLALEVRVRVRVRVSVRVWVRVRVRVRVRVCPVGGGYVENGGVSKTTRSRDFRVKSTEVTGLS